MLQKFGFVNITIDSVDFDGNFFLVNGFEKGEEEKVRFIVKISINGNVVGWKLT